MTELDRPNGPENVVARHGAAGAVAASSRRRGFAVAVIVIAVAVVAAGTYWLMSGSFGGRARAQDPAPRDNTPQLVKDGGRITVPSGSPLRGKLAIVPVAEKEIQRSLVLPAVVEADPARTVKVLPPVAGRVIELKVELGARVAKGDVLAVMESGDLAM